MELSITEFRCSLFEVVAKVLAGEDVVVTHKGKRFRVVPEIPVDRLSRLTPLHIQNPETPESAERALRTEMEQAWERDWAEL